MKAVDDCEVHACATELRELRVGDPLKISLKDSPAYLWAKRKTFPHSDDVVAAKGIRRTLLVVKIPVCSKCCEQRDQFLLTKYPIWSRTHELAC